MLKDHISTLDVMFDVLALSETWPNDNSSDTVNVLMVMTLCHVLTAPEKEEELVYKKKIITT